MHSKLGSHPADAAITDWLASRPEWRDREYREAYAQEAITQGIAWQIKINRRRRKLSQKALADLLCTKQSAISRMEDPDYGSHSLETLVKVAKVFDCALMVKLASYSQLADESERLSIDDQYAVPFEIEARVEHD